MGKSLGSLVQISKGSLQVDVRRSKTLLLKLPNHHAVEKETHWERTTLKGDGRGLKLKLCPLKSPQHFMVDAPWRSAFDIFLITLYQHFVHGKNH